MKYKGHQLENHTLERWNQKIRTLRNQIHDVYSWVNQEHEQTAKKMKYTWNPARRESSLSTSRSCKSHKYQIVSHETV